MNRPTVCIEYRESDQKLYFHEFPLLLGRIHDADIPVTDPWVNQFHCRVEFVDGTLLIRDLNSQNGTHVNGCRISVSPLMPGDEVRVGCTRFRVTYDRGSIVPPPSVIYHHSITIRQDPQPESCRLGSGSVPGNYAQ